MDAELASSGSVLDTELLKEVIRGPEGTFTGYIRALKGTGKTVKEEGKTETTTTQTMDGFGSYVQQQGGATTTGVKTSTTLN